MLSYINKMIKSLEPVSYEIVKTEDNAYADGRLDVIATGLYHRLVGLGNEGKTYSIADLAIMYDTPIEYIEEGLSRIERLGYIRKKQ